MILNVEFIQSLLPSSSIRVIKSDALIQVINESEASAEFGEMLLERGIFT